MRESDPKSVQEWLRRAADGDAESWRHLLDQHHERLRRMAAIRLDPRLRGRLDPSDVLQDVYLEASERLSDYLRTPTLPFFLWLRALAGNRLARLHRHHLETQRRDAGQEVPVELLVTPEVSSAVMAAHFLAVQDRPSAAASRYELRERLQAILERLSAADREVLSLRHFEQLSTAETAAVLNVSEATAGKRYVRALTRLRVLLAHEPDLLKEWKA